MPTLDSGQLVRLILAGAAFVCVLALWLAGVLLWRLKRSGQEKQIQERLGLTQPVGGPSGGKVLRLWHEGGVAEMVVSSDTRLTLGQRLEQLRVDAGWTVPIIPLLAGLVVGVILLSVVLWMATGNPLVAIVVAVLLLVAFNGYLQHCVNRRTALFERQLVDAIELGARSLRAGHPLSGAFHLVAEEVPEPVGALFGRICEQEELGLSVQDALKKSAAESRSPDLKIFAVSVIIQLRSGGNLADMMDRLGGVVRERMRLNRRARVLTAEAQLSKWVLLALPLGMFLVLNVMNPEYMKPLYTTFVGQVMMAVSGTSLLLGAWIMGRMAVLKY